jgi:hypothetical protein
VTAPPGIGSAWPGGRLLVTDQRAPELDLSAAVGQMQATYRFELINGVTGEHLDDITPIRGASLTHDTSMTTKRTLNMSLGKSDTAAVNALVDRVLLFMTIPGAPNPDRADGDWPLGRYMWSDNPRRLSTGGRLAQPVLTDEMLLVDQEIQAGISGIGVPVSSVLTAVLSGLPIVFDVEQSSFESANSWARGAGRGQVLETLSQVGDYWSPWFDNHGVLRFRRTFDPAARVPDLDFDRGYRVLRQDIVETDELLTAPNRFVVISNAAKSGASPVVGVADVAVNAPNSIPNIGFIRSKTLDLQLSDAGQAAAVAQGLVQRQAIFEQVVLSTPADPRHDGYSVIRWQGENWLELGWTMPLVMGEAMVHTLRRSYGPGSVA